MTPQMILLDTQTKEKGIPFQREKLVMLEILLQNSIHYCMGYLRDNEVVTVGRYLQHYSEWDEKVLTPTHVSFSYQQQRYEVTHCKFSKQASVKNVVSLAFLQYRIMPKGRPGKKVPILPINTIPLIKVRKNKVYYQFKERPTPMPGSPLVTSDTKEIIGLHHGYHGTPGDDYLVGHLF